MKIKLANSYIAKIKQGEETVILKMQIEKDTKNIIKLPITFSFTKENLIIEQIPSSIVLPSVYELEEWKEEAGSLIFTTKNHYSVQSIIVKEKNSKIVISIKFKNGNTIDFTEAL